MKTIPIILLLVGLLGCTTNNRTTNTDQNDTLAVYDSVLAKKLGADDYGMKKYVMAFLKRGPNRSPDSAVRAQLQQAHLQNIQRMADKGKLIVAGPFLDTLDVRGIYIFNVESVEEAKALTETDPAIKAGSLVMELRPWYGSAALIESVKTHKTIAKSGIGN